MENTSFAFTFVAGLISFLSPCILPIIPGFLAYLAGSTSDAPDANNRRNVFLASVFFVLGFSVVFASLGVILNGVLSAFTATAVQVWLARIGGLVIIVFGLFLTRLIRIPFLEQSHALSVKTKFKSKYLTSFVFGAAFAAGWTPCVGAVLGSILVLAISNPGSAFLLLMSYSLGLGLPFLVVGLFASQTAKFIERYGSILKYVNIVFGVILIVVGVLAFTQSLSSLTSLGFINDLLLN